MCVYIYLCNIIYYTHMFYALELKKEVDDNYIEYFVNRFIATCVNLLPPSKKEKEKKKKKDKHKNCKKKNK